MGDFSRNLRKSVRQSPTIGYTGSMPTCQPVVMIIERWPEGVDVLVGEFEGLIRFWVANAFR